MISPDSDPFFNLFHFQFCLFNSPQIKSHSSGALELGLCCMSPLLSLLPFLSLYCPVKNKKYPNIFLIEEGLGMQQKALGTAK